ncbi:DNA packaging terminase subunit 2 [Cervid alphaherpesvirus 3]|uniref:DNA packaging terminase subunit 2 n=1 Tax=Cervid alphaherpesvirus 3 TaxID=2115790 RepID=A0A455JMT8_9ALPH|nr:DNA packaging terminase subunit 2 [Cervid alphaherpesvirus 3]AVT50616.1 DNA packaging terminase subunit 2 [Cervid alphaherpesvirus 3]
MDDAGSGAGAGLGAGPDAGSGSGPNAGSGSGSGSGSGAGAGRGGAAARQRLLAILGQVQTYNFQLALLGRCDPAVVRRHLDAVKLNALMARWLRRRLGGALRAQARVRLTPLTYALDLALDHAAAESDALLAAAAAPGAPAEFFARTMGLGGACRLHRRARLELYGGETVDIEIQFLHDVENFLKQLNFAHLLASADAALAALGDVDAFLRATVAGGGVAPPELHDPAQPCLVCFEELCVTANQGESVGRRLAQCVCDHVTRQLRVRTELGGVAQYLPHLQGVPRERLAAATAALEALEAPPGGGGGASAAAGAPPGGEGGGDGDGGSVREAAASVLDAHHVFRPAPRWLYAVSELQFWMSSSARGEAAASAVAAFAGNLEALAAREARHGLQVAAAELALFGRAPEHFDRALADRLARLDGVDGLLVGSAAAAPDERLEALIRACYDHHMSASLVRRLTRPDQRNEDALRELLRRAAAGEAGAGEEGDGGGAGAGEEGDGAGGAGAGGEDGPGGDAEDGGPAGWAALAARARADAEVRRQRYAERLSKRSMDSLGRCIRDQRRELEKTLRVSVYGDVLLGVYVAVHNGFCARRAFRAALADAGTVVDNRASDATFDAHRFMKEALLRHAVDPATWPALTHQFFDLVNGPLFDGSAHNFAQPPNTALYFSVENVGLLPHLKAELAAFMLAAAGGGWAVSDFQRFFCFASARARGVTAAQRLAWRYIRELVLARAVFASVFHCGRVPLLRADRTAPGPDGRQSCPSGVYLTYEESCPLAAVLNAPRAPETVGADSVVILDRDVFSLLYAVLQRLAPEGRAPR